MLKPNVAVDIDGVIAEQLGPALRAINIELNLPRDRWLTAADMHDYYFEKVVGKRFGLVAEQTVAALMARIFIDPAYLSQQPVILPAIKGMRRLAGAVEELHLVTARPGHLPAVKAATEAWLDRYGINRTHLAFETDKGAYLRQHRIDYIVEDSPSTAIKCHRHGFGVFVIDYPFNLEANAKHRMWRVRDVGDVVEPLLADWAVRAAGVAR